MDNLKLLQAMQFIAENLTYSETYKRDLMDEIQSMIDQEVNTLDYFMKHSAHPEPDYDSAGFSVLDRETPPLQ